MSELKTFFGVDIYSLICQLSFVYIAICLKYFFQFRFCVKKRMKVQVKFVTIGIL